MSTITSTRGRFSSLLKWALDAFTNGFMYAGLFRVGVIEPVRIARRQRADRD
jgi:hypothetical protein